MVRTLTGRFFLLRGRKVVRAGFVAVFVAAPLLLGACGSEEQDSRNAIRPPGNVFEIAVDNPYQLQSGPDLRDLDVTDEIVAQRFTSNDGPTRITLVNLGLSRGAESAAPREVVLTLHSSVNGMPGPSIAELGVRAVDPGFAGMRTVPVTSSPVLAASRQYFVVVSPGSGTGSLAVQTAVNVPLSNVSPAPEFESYQSPGGAAGSWLPTGTGRNVVMTIVVEATGASSAASTTVAAPPSTAASVSTLAPTTTAVNDDGQTSAGATSTAPGSGGQVVPGATSTSIGSTGSPSSDSTVSATTLVPGSTATTVGSAGLSPSDSTVPGSDSTTVTRDTIIIFDEFTEPSLGSSAPVKGEPYSPANDPDTTRELSSILAAFAALAAAGAAGALGGVAGAGASAGPPRGRLSTLATKKLKATATSRAGAGDAGNLWRRKGTGRVDRVFSRIPEKVAPYSSVAPRVLVDGSWARAMLGSSALVLWPIALATGIVWGLDTGGNVGLPAGWIFAVALVIGVLDSMAGGLVALAFTSVVLAAGGVGDWSDVRTVLGVWVVLLSPPLIGNVIRPMRRVIHDIEAGLRERIFDYVMAPVGVAFAIEAMTKALNGLSGTVLADGSDLGLVKWTVWIAMLARLGVEDLAVHYFPDRSRAVQPPRLPGQTKTWGIVAAILRFSVYLFVSEPYFGLGWATVFAALLLSVPFAMKPWEDDLPNNATLWKWLPRGFLRFAVLVLLGGWLGVALLGDDPTADTVRAMTPWLFLPSAVFAITEYFGRSGEPWADSRLKRWGGSVLWVFVVLVLAGVIDPF